MTETFPSVGWFRALADRMGAQPEKYRKLGAMEFTLVPRITFPDGHSELYSLIFEGHHCRAVERIEGDFGALRGTHAVVLEGDYEAWKEMIDSILRHGGADLTHTLNYLTLPDWPLRLLPVDASEGQLDVDRFYRYNHTLQVFFNEAASIESRFAA